MPGSVSAEITTTYDGRKPRVSAGASAQNENVSAQGGTADPIRDAILTALHAMPNADLSELADIVTAWPKLAEPIRQRIVGLVEGATAR